jgi:iron(III) transport system permease protein
MAVGLLWTYGRPPFVLYGTIWILVAAYITHYLPFPTRSVSSSMIQLDKSLEEAAIVHGASWTQMFKDIILPLIKPGLITGWLILFVKSWRDFTTSILLYSPGNEPISIATYAFYEEYLFGPMAALTVLQAIITLLIIVALMKTGGKSFSW